MHVTERTAPRHAGLSICRQRCFVAAVLLCCACGPRPEHHAATAGGESGTQGPGGNSTPGATSNVPDPNDASAGANDMPEPTLPFAPLGPQQAARKVKNLLVGGALTDAEWDTLASNNNDMSALIATWMNSPEYQTTLFNFFLDAFQQNYGTIGNIRAVSGSLTLSGPTISNLRDSFAKTALYFVNQEMPFTNVATTTSFMMTTTMMGALAFDNLLRVSDTGRTSNLWMQTNPNLVVKVQDRVVLHNGISLNPADPNYGLLYWPGLTAGASKNPNCADFNGTIAIAPQRANSAWTRGLYLPYGYTNARWSYVKADGTVCVNTSYNGVTKADYNDWRMVSVRQPAPGEKTDTFFELDRLRTSNTLVLTNPRVGYFTTVPFLAAWPSNISNQARLTINQTMIVGLGDNFNGSNTTLQTVLPAVDPSHSDINTPCFGCHRNMDPMRQFFRRSFNYGWSPQDDANVLALPATFSFNSPLQTGSSVYDLGKLIAQNEGFAAAWVQKMCVWANSKPCDDTDPEFLRVVAAFKGSNFSWNTMMKTLMASPIITYTKSSPTGDATGGLVSIARRNQFCHALNARLNLQDFCQQSGVVGGGTGSNLTTAIPADGVTRGKIYASVATAASITHRMTIENVCSQAATAAVDTGAVPALRSTDPNAAVSFLTGTLMGLSASEAAVAAPILKNHFNDVVQAAAADANFQSTAPKVALTSTFVAACLSPTVAAIGL